MGKKFEIVRSKRTISGRGPSVRADIDVRTGEAEVARAIKGLGFAVAGIGKKYYLAQADKQFSEAIRLSQEEINRLSISFNANLNPDTFQNEYKKSLATIKELTPKNRSGASAFNEWLGEKTPQWQMAIEESRWRRMKDNYRAEGFRIKTQTEQTGIVGPYIQHLAKGKKLGIYKAEEYEKLASSAMKDMPLYAARTQLNLLVSIDQIDDPAILFDQTDFTVAEVLSALDFDKFKLTPKQRDILRSDAKTIANDRIKAAKVKLELIQRQQDIDFFARYRIDLQPSEIVQAVEEHRLSREAGDRWLNRLAGPRDYPTDPNTEATLLKQITDPEVRITESDILDLIGKPEGISTATARRFIADMDFFTDPWFKRIDMFLKSQLGWDGAYEKFVHPEGGLAYKLASDKLFDAIETQKLKGREIYDVGSSIAIPFIVSYWEKALIIQDPEKIKRMRMRLEGEKVKPEPKTKRPKPIIEKSDAIDPKGIWK